MKKILPLVAATSIILLASSLLYLYIQSHPTYLWALQDPSTEVYKNLKNILLPLLITTISSGVIAQCYHKQKIKKSALLLLFIPLLTALLLSSHALLSPEKIALYGPQNPPTLFIKSFFYIFFLSSTSILFLLIIKNIGQSTTQKITPLLSPTQEKEEKQNHILHIIYGGIILIIIGWILGKIGHFSLITISLILLLGIFISTENFHQNTKKIFQHKLSLSNKIDHIFFIIFATLLSLNLAQSLFPFSLGWDSATQYLLTTKTLITEGVLRNGIFPPCLEIINAIYGIFTGITGVQFFIIFIGSLIAPIALFSTPKILPHISPTTNKILALSILIIPAIQFQLSRDIKFDPILLGLFIIAIAQLTQKQTKSASLIIGFLLWAKLTYIWAIPGFIITLILIHHKKLQKIIIDLILLALPISLVIITNLISYHLSPQKISPSFSQNFIYQLLKGPSNTPSINTSWEGFSQTNTPTTENSQKQITKSQTDTEKQNITNTPKTKNIPPQITPTGFTEEVSRYINYQNSIFQKIYATFTSPAIDNKAKQYVDLGFWWLCFLILIPFYLLSQIPQLLKKNPPSTSQKNIYLLLPTTISFLLGWILIGHGIGWYAIPLIFLLNLIGFYIITQIPLSSKPQKIYHTILSILILTTAILHIILGRAAHSPQENFYTSFSFTVAPNQNNAYRLSQYFFQAEKNTAEFINADKTGNILRIGTMIPFWLENAEHRLINDPQLDLFQTFSSQGHLGTLHQLKKNHIKFIVVDRATTSIQKDPNGSLHKKFKQLEKFLHTAEQKQQIEILLISQKIVLIKVIN